jgi:Dolichyl-phosphate-mannose-protein mannosyltransferase
MTTRQVGIFLGFILALHVTLLAWGATAQSPTIDEIAYLPAGLSHWQLGNFELANVSPPLIPSIAAAPLLLVGAESDWSSLAPVPEAFMAHDVGCDFLKANGSRSLYLFTLARWQLIPLSVLGAICCYLWARDLAGQRAGLLSASLWCFCPNIVAHAQLVTTDAGATVLGIAAAYTFWRWLKWKTWKSAIIAGIALGFAESAKTTLLIFAAIWPLLWLAWNWPTRDVECPAVRPTPLVPSLAGTVREWLRTAQVRTEWKRGACQLAMVLFIAWYILNSMYAFDGSFKRLGHFRFVSKALVGNGWEPGEAGNRFTRSWLAALPIPVPEQYLLGIDLQRRDLENIDPTHGGLYRSYLRGEWRTSGWWYYYLYGLGIKVPLGSWILVAIAMWLRGRAPAQRADWRNDLLLLVPLVAVLVLVSSQTGFSTHVRYVLPLFPFAFVWVARSICAARLRSKACRHAVVTALTWSIVSSLWAAPHDLSYFNELSGGPRGGYFHLADSNIDWGQDLLYLRKWIATHPEARPMKVAYIGLFPPELIGITFPWPPPSPIQDASLSTAAELPPGWYAISVGYVQGEPFNGELHLQYFSRLKPLAFAGYSIYIYHVPPKGLTSQQEKTPSRQCGN